MNDPTVSAVAGALAAYMPSMGRQVWEQAARAALCAVALAVRSRP